MEYIKDIDAAVNSFRLLYVVFGVGLFITFGQLIAFNRMYESEKFWKNLSNQKSK